MDPRSAVFAPSSRRRLAACALAALLMLLGALAEAAEPLLLTVARKQTGDLDRMLARREIRALVAHSRTDYEVVKGRQVGFIYDVLSDLERRLNADFAPAAGKQPVQRKRRLPIRLTIVAVPYDQLYDKLAAGYGDIVASPMLITPYAESRVDFTAPFYDEAKEVLVTRSGDAIGDGIEAIAGRPIYVRYSSGFYQTLLEINRQLTSAGRQPARLIAADEHLSDDEMMEMVSAGIVEATVTYRFRARLWSQIFDNLQVNEHNVLMDRGRIAWAVRKDSPKLREYLDAFIEHDNVAGAARRNRYFASTRFARNSLDHDGQERFASLVSLFERYAGQYSFDHLLLMAQGYQESQLDQNARSPVGAIGIMQVMPQTGAALKVGDVHRLEPNIHAGAKYLDILRKRYFNDPAISPLDQTYFSFAAYNAGPGNIRKMRSHAKRMGLDPNVWFDNVELATLRYIGREPVQYVSNIHKYYLAYRLYRDNARPLVIGAR